MKLMIYTLLTTTWLASSAYAEETERNSLWGLGLATVAGDKGYKDVGITNTTLPFIYYETENFQLLGPTFGYAFSKSEDLKLSFIGQYRLDGYKEDDGDIFDGMESRSDSLDLGLSAEYETIAGDVSLAFLQDAINEHEGHELSLTYAAPYFFSSAMLKPYIKLIRQSDDLVDYYYGVRKDEARANREYYRAKATTNFETGVQASYQYGRHHNFITYASYTAYGSEIKDSPLVDKSGSFNLILGYMYVF